MHSEILTDGITSMDSITIELVFNNQPSKNKESQSSFTTKALGDSSIGFNP